MALHKVLAEKGSSGEGVTCVGHLQGHHRGHQPVEEKGIGPGCFSFSSTGFHRNCFEGILALRSYGLGGAEGPHPYPVPPPTGQEQWLRVGGLHRAPGFCGSTVASLNPSGPREPPNQCPVVGRHQGPSPLQEVQPSPRQSSTSCPPCHPAGGNAVVGNYGITVEAGEGQCRTDVPTPHQHGPPGTALPPKAGKEAENRFLFFHRVPSIYRPGRSGSFHPGHPERTGPRASPGPTWSVSRLGQPTLRKALGWAWVGRGTEPREGRRVQPFWQRLCPSTARSGSM